jgi:hypothetical protein
MAGIVWLASYPKSGSTWLRSFLHNFLSAPDQSYDINRLTDLTAGESMTALYRAQDPALGQHYTDERVRELRPLVHRAISRASPYGALVKTHNALVSEDGHPLISLDLTAGAIYVVRNPLDIAVSFSHHNRTTIDNIIEFMNTESAATQSNEKNVYEVYDTWSAHVASWTETPSSTLHVMRYEDMLAHPQKSFAAIVKLLGIEAPRQRIEKAVRLSSFQVLKEQERRQGFRERPARMEAFFRAGKAGQWKKELTKEQVARVVSAHREQMARFGYVPEGM